MDNVKGGDEVELAGGKLRTVGDLEGYAISDTSSGRVAPRALDRFGVKVVAEHSRVRECLCHQDSRAPAAATNVGRAPAALQPLDDLRHRRNPFARELELVARQGIALGRLEHQRWIVGLS